MPFKRRLVKNYSNIWAISRSSKFLYKKMTQNIDFNVDLKIVEFWPWDWVFTDELLKQITKNSQIHIFEIDEWFCKLLKEKYKNEKRVKIYEESACNIWEYFEKSEIDYVISSLPLSFINKNIVDTILEKSKQILKNSWNYIQYQYFLQNKKQINKYFPQTDYKFTFLNLPPAFIYICHK